ncbi:MAG: adenylate/guanylate cyclase domain-containing protein [Planctomycetes bacterium]|nr:adenylate/guanylate cyclase domain-containing protein [Planctomycetota bacterium]
MRKNIAGTLNSSGRISIGLLIGLAVTVLIAIIGQVSWPGSAELKLLDTRQKYFSEATFSPDIVHLDIDDDSIEKIGDWPWPRRNLAHLVHLCHEAGARQIVLDIIMPDESRPQLHQDGTTDFRAFEPQPVLVGQPPVVRVDNDVLLAEALLEAQNVTIPYHAEILLPSSTPSIGDRDNRFHYPEVRQILLEEPTPSFAEVFSRIWPDRNITDRDPEYMHLYRSYLYCLSQKYLERFYAGSAPANHTKAWARLGRLTLPIPQLAETVTNSGYATAFVDPEDGVARRIPLVAIYEDRLHKQLSFAVACKVLGIEDGQLDFSDPRKIVVNDPEIELEIPLDENQNMLIAWPGPWQENPNHLPVVFVGQIWLNEQDLQQNQNQLNAINTLSYQLSTVPEDISMFDEQTQQQIQNMRDQLAMFGEPEDLIRANENLEKQIIEAKTQLKEKLDGKIVLVGSTTTGAFDFVVSPMSTRTPGVAVHGNILGTILQRQFLKRLPTVVDFCLVLLLGSLMTLITVYLSPFKSILSGVGLIVLTLFSNFVLAFQYGHIWLGIVTPLVAILFSFIAVTFYSQITEGRARRRITARFKQYTSPAVVDQIVASASHVHFEGETRQISCYFSDIAGFTTISEHLGPQKTVHALNIYLDRMTEALDRYDATVNKFLGDGIFAFFGAPISQPDHARRACQAALSAQEELDKLVQQQRDEDPDFPPLKMRIGISTGEVVVGDCGSHRKFDYTAIGDTVNLGARLESANKAFGSRIMICQNTFDHCTDIFQTRRLGSVRVVGKKQGVGIYELLSPNQLADEKFMSYKELFEKGLDHFQLSQFEKATEFFDQCLKQNHGDKAAKLYLNTAHRFTADAPPEDFSGCIELTEK